MSKRERYNKYMREWYARNKERICAANRAKPRDWAAAYQRRKLYMKGWHARNKERIRIAHRDPAYRAIANARGRAYNKTAVSILWRIRMRAKKKGIVCELTKEWLQARLDAGVCELTGLPFTPQGLLAPAMPSVDRKDSSKGYTPDNCRLICWALNAAFNNWGETEARKIWVEYLRRNP
jgi:hypothetical protein